MNKANTGVALIACTLSLIPPSVLILEGCHRSDGETESSQQYFAPPQVLNEGAQIRFTPDSPQLLQIATDTVRERTVRLDFSAPAHLSVSAVGSDFGNRNVLLFENQDLTQLYSDFIKSSSAVTRSGKNLERVRDLCAHKAAAEKDLLDAQTEQTQAEAEMAEKESRLRAAGIDPRSLEHLTPGSILAIADIPEGRVAGIKLSTRAEVECNAFPGQPMEGRVTSIGDVIDPNTRTVKVRITLPNLRNRLRAGMFGSARLVGSGESTLTVSRNSVVNVEGKAYVFVQSVPGLFVRREIQIGSETSRLYAVNGGLRSGDIVASGGVMLLKQLSFGY